jgi:hypothetical protein
MDSDRRALPDTGGRLDEELAPRKSRPIGFGVA